VRLLQLALLLLLRVFEPLLPPLLLLSPGISSGASPVLGSAWPLLLTLLLCVLA
jgi:hypothetical protein